MADSKPLQLHPQQNAAAATATTIDRISDLPDSILCHILSFLPTLTAVTTGLLSRRWRHLWKYLQVFSFDYSSENPIPNNNYVDASSETLESAFINFVNTVLSLRRSPDIHEFRLSWWSHRSDLIHSLHFHLDTWLRRDAIGPHLRLLKLYLVDTLDYRMFPLPLTVFTSCTGLVTLSLEGEICVEEEQQQLSVVNFPSLKTLRLGIRGGPINVILSGCPVVETLSLHLTPKSRKYFTEQFGKIQMPTSLKRLDFSDELDLEIEDLVIDTPSLEELYIELRTKCSNYSFKNLQNMARANLEFVPLDDGVTEDFVLRLLGALTRTKYLNMILPTLPTQLLDFPKFGNLLQLRLAFLYFNLEFMVTLLQNCDILQDLRIQQGFQEETFDAESWTQPLTDPNCLRSHLINFEFNKYQGSACAKAFVTYILQRGLVLKTVKIYHRVMPMFELSEAKRHILSIERGSNMCHVNFPPICP